MIREGVITDDIFFEKLTEMMFSCEVCKKKFRNNKVFKAHSRKYHLELPCTDCEKKFGSRMALKAHVKAKHAE